MLGIEGYSPLEKVSFEVTSPWLTCHSLPPGESQIAHSMGRIEGNLIKGLFARCGQAYGKKDGSNDIREQLPLWGLKGLVGLGAGRRVAAEYSEQRFCCGPWVKGPSCKEKAVAWRVGK